MMMLKLAEKFASINGEGKKAGEPAIFIRFSGCNLDCVYCDTKWAMAKDAWKEEISLDALKTYLIDQGIKNITITGGEPLLQDGIETVVKELLQEGYFIEIETNGSQMINNFEFYDYSNLSFTVDYKLPGSGQESFMCHDNYRLLSLKDSVKFVITDDRDLYRAKEIVDKYNLMKNTTVYFSAAFSNIKNQDIVAFMLHHKLNGVKLQLQLHKYIWDPHKQGV